MGLYNGYFAQVAAMDPQGQKMTMIMFPFSKSLKMKGKSEFQFYKDLTKTGRFCFAKLGTDTTELY